VGAEPQCLLNRHPALKFHAPAQRILAKRDVVRSGEPLLIALDVSRNILFRVVLVFAHATFQSNEESALEERVTGSVRNVAGRVESGIGRATGDSKIEAQGLMDQAQGTAEKAFGAAKDAASGVADVVRNTVENRPYTAVAVALGLGWLFGRTHRPL
jgi:uncharacterized protein YjbJ (UPF0337 family)